MVDTTDPERLAAFWSELLGVGIRHRSDPSFIWLDRQRAGGVSPAFQKVDHPTPGKNRLHLDGSVGDLETTTRRVVELGGTLVESHTEQSFVWNVYADPDGNVFCLGHPAG